MSSILEDLKLQYRVGDLTTKLIFWEVFLFLILTVISVFSPSIFERFVGYIALPGSWQEMIVKPWTLITYSFFHIRFFHLLFNMLMLMFAGRLFATFFTQKQFIGLYILGGILGGIVFLLGYQFLPSLRYGESLIGASASVMAILVATTVYQPDYSIRIGFIGNVKLWHIALVFLLLDLIQLPVDNSGGHMAHFGGALFGYIYIKALKSGIDLTSGLNVALDRIVTLFSSRKSTPFKRVHKNVKVDTAKTTSRVVTKDKTQQQIDEILDKISQSGYDSLTKEEKEFLFKAGK
ncbi:rhomboid family intramembrane serine protease [Flavobacterium amniphilum]|uniref:rhomboid family intramembrane serine protease n=1 Tax=Flavobacterium amniphilum TaxID=1834035 RepID=UPI00202A394D|nr:rhomboid family intramembrane serine protease [Flavobacterium amniphilum]MCL9805045.1 rhomboid family intramembrane serine protease [Flavobacterium amniphilum]